MPASYHEYPDHATQNIAKQICLFSSYLLLWCKEYGYNMLLD
jgi:hypothetical protein